MAPGGYQYSQYYNSQPNHSQLSHNQYQHYQDDPRADKSRPSSNAQNTSHRYDYTASYNNSQYGAQQRRFEPPSHTTSAQHQRNPSQYATEQSRYEPVNPPSNIAPIQQQYRVRSPANSSYQPTQTSYGPRHEEYPSQHGYHREPQTSHTYDQRDYQPMFTQTAAFTSGNAHSTPRSQYTSSAIQHNADNAFRNGTDISPPATVDPTAVYDASHEYRRHQALANTAKRARDPEAENSNHNCEPQQAKDLGRSTVKAWPGSDAQTQKHTENQRAIQATEQIQAATSMALLQNPDSSPNQKELEAQMRELFKKMREFNSRDPDMLARLWQQERDDYTRESAACEKMSTEQAQSKSNTTSKAKPPKGSQPQQQPSTEQTNPTSEPQQKKQTNKKPRKQKPIDGPPTNLGSSNTNAAVGAGSHSSKSSKRSAPGPLSESTNGNAPAPAAALESKNGFILPEDNKLRVAITIAELLKQEFSGKSISPTEICTFLSTNPSYIEFCQIVEAHGFQLNRNQFARALMSTIPSLGSRTDRGSAMQFQTSGANQTPVSPSALTSSAGITATVGVRPPTTNAQTATNSSPKKSKPKAGTATDGNSNIDPSLEGLDAVKQFVEGTSTVQPPGPSTAQPKEKKSGKGQSKRSLTPHPPTKYDLARKRNFGDLVDLARLDNSSDDELSLPLPPGQVADPTKMPTPLATSPEASQADAAPKDNSSSSKPKLAQNTNGVMDNLVPNASLGLSIPGEKMVKPLDKYKAIRRSSYDPRTIARDVLLASGRHPHMRYLNAHLEPLRSTFADVDNNSDLSTFRWDIADPGGPAVGSNSVVPSNEPALPEAMDADDDSDNENNGNSATRVVRQAVSANGGTALIEPATRATTSLKHSKTGIRRHGGDASQSGATPQPGSYGGSSYRELRLAQEAEARARGETFVPKRGRPPGWRKSMMKSPADYKPTPAKGKSGKPSPEPVYQVYKCEWKDCGAELHNLATLRKHLFKLHGKPDASGQYLCLWSGCGKVKTITDSATNRMTSKFATEEFPTKDAWKEHAEKKHLSPIAWKLGDGPKGGVSDNYESEISESYASDSQGRRVTPKVEVPTDFNKPNAQPKRLSQLEREAEMEKQAERNRKRDIGPGMDRQGATLANAERRRGFIDDADVMEVVDDDD